MSRRTLALLAAFFVLALGVVWLASRRASESEVDISVRSSESTTVRASVELVAPRSVTADLPDSNAREVADVPGSVELPIDAVWFDGRVEFPPGTPSDERVFVVARGNDVIRPRADRFPVDGDGRFRAAFERRSHKPELSIEARFLYLDPPVRVDLHAPSEIVLAPRLGGCARVRLAPSSFARARASAVRASDVVAFPSEHDERKVGGVTAPDGVIELHGLTAEESWWLVVGSPGLTSRSAPELAIAAGRVVDVDVSLLASARLAGTVRDQRGAPIADVDVRSEGRVGGERLSVKLGRTDSNGRFEGFVGEWAPVTVFAVRPGYTPAESESFDLQEGFDREDIDLRLGDGLAISGVVHGVDGGGLADVRVRVLEEINGRPEPLSQQTVSTDASGSFRVQGLFAGSKYTLLAKARSGSAARPIWLRATAAGVDPGASDVVLQLSAGTELRARIVDDTGRSLDACTLVARATTSEPDPAVISRRVQGKEGLFVLEGVEKGEWDLSAYLLERVSSPPVRIDLPQDAGRTIELVVPRPARVSGIVLDVDGKPSAGAVVVINTGEDSDLYRPRNPCGEDGRFVIGSLAPGPTEFVARQSERAASLASTIQLVAGQELELTPLRLRTGATIEGRVTDRTGAPVEGATIATHSEVHGSQLRESLTQADGSYRIEHVDPGAVTVYCSTIFAANEERTSRELSVEDGQVVRVDLGGSVQGNHIVRGSVRAGSPVRGATVSFVPDEIPDGPWPEATTDAAGRYEIGLAHPGPYRAVVHADGFAMLHRELVVSNAPTSEIDFEFGTGRIAGTVVGPDGRECSGISVSLHAPFGLGSEGRCRPRTGGRFAFDGLVPGTYAVRVQGPGDFAPGIARDLRIEDGTKLEGIVLTLSAGAVLTVRVLHLDGRPAQGARVQWDLDPDQPGYVIPGTDAQGFARLSGLPAGALRIGACAEFETASATTQVRAGETSAITLSLTPAGRIAVVFTGRDGKVLTDGGPNEVEVTDARGRHPDWMESREDGALACDVPPGKYTIRARFGAREVAGDVDVTAGIEHRLVLQEPD